MRSTPLLSLREKRVTIENIQKTVAEYVYQPIPEVGGDVRIRVSDERRFLKYRRDPETSRQRQGVLAARRPCQ